MNNIGIHAYVYNNKRHPVGVLAAAPSNANSNEVIIGWSRCNQGAGDRFNKHEGVRIAYERSLTGSTRDVPESMSDAYVDFYQRAHRYFQDRNVVV